MQYLLIPLFAILNRARGTQFFSLTGSTTEGRIIAMLLMGIAAACLRIGDSLLMAEIIAWTFAALMLYATFSWDYLWSATIGSAGAATGFPPVDWIMSIIWKMPAHSATGMNWHLRLWGMLALGLRMTLAAPFLVGMAFLAGHPENAYIAAFTPLLAVPYFIFGLLFHFWPKFDAYTISLSELSVGAMLGVFTLATMGIL